MDRRLRKRPAKDDDTMFRHGRKRSKETNAALETKILKVCDPHPLGHFVPQPQSNSRLKEWKVASGNSKAMQHLTTAAKAIRAGTYPVAFPTETVYGLGADATESRAVQGIYEAKGRPSDNPLIVHICDIDMYTDMMEGLNFKEKTNPFLARYDVLMDKFWPGPLTLLFPKPPQYLAPEVTAGLDTVGIRMPNSGLALTLIKLAGVPVAAPSANSSTKPSPTTAAHVFHDLDGKIKYIVDGGPCDVGVESTVVDGLRDPPIVLRPGGISIDEIRQCPGWENVQKGYKDESETGDAAPRAPGMKYKHYSPDAMVILCENSFVPVPQSTPGLTFYKVGDGSDATTIREKLMASSVDSLLTVGIIRTKHWARWLDWDGQDGHTFIAAISPEAVSPDSVASPPPSLSGSDKSSESSATTATPALAPGGIPAKVDNLHLEETSGDGAAQANANEFARTATSPSDASIISASPTNSHDSVTSADLEYRLARLFNDESAKSFGLRLIDVKLGSDTRQIASGLFAALREMDKRGANVIFVEGITDDGGVAAAVMNRLRKAATQRW